MARAPTGGVCVSTVMVVTADPARHGPPFNDTVNLPDPLRAAAIIFVAASLVVIATAALIVRGYLQRR